MVAGLTGDSEGAVSVGRQASEGGDQVQKDAFAAVWLVSNRPIFSLVEEIKSVHGTFLLCTLYEDDYSNYIIIASITFKVWWTFIRGQGIQL